MSLSLGMIEWVNHTKPMKSCIESQEPNIKKWRIVRDSYNSWIIRHAPRSKNIAGKKKINSRTRFGQFFLTHLISSTFCCVR